MLKRLNQGGDTIVEVMMVLAVLGLAIGISYATANRSLLASKAAQESAQANSLLLGQLEALRALASVPKGTAGTIYRPQNSVFCINTQDPANLAIATGFVGTPPLDVKDYAVYPAPAVPPGSPAGTQPVQSPCIVDNGGYKIYLSITVTDTATDTYVLKAVWDDIQSTGGTATDQGNGKASSALAYRVHQVVAQ